MPIVGQPEPLQPNDTEDESVDDILDEVDEIAASLQDTFRHNRVIDSLQEWREERVTRLQERLETLRNIWCS